ncbi:pilus assembly protein TadG-related protein, partial [Candidatus Omnitrophota bacterium]
MKRVKLKIILDNLKNRRGQVFPFFVLILVVIIIATMAYVNLSQVDTHKIDTMNAADAAALAGASSLAQAANGIADINVRN